MIYVIIMSINQWEVDTDLHLSARIECEKAAAVQSVPSVNRHAEPSFLSDISTHGLRLGKSLFAQAFQPNMTNGRQGENKSTQHE